MQYMLMMHAPKDGYTQYLNWPRAVLEANVAFMQDFSRRLRDTGELVITAGLASPEQARLVRAGDDGRPVTDGVFAESKEFLAGWWIVDVDGAERAYEIAADASKAPGLPVKAADGSLIPHVWIEVRQVMGSRKDME